MEGKVVVRVRIPRVVTDNPMVTFESRDGKFAQSVTLTSPIIRWMNGKYEGYFELEIRGARIVGLTPVGEERFFNEPEEEAERE